MADFKTNAVDSFVVEKIGSGAGECKIYLRGSTNDSYYRGYFDINSRVYGVDSNTWSGVMRYRDKGPEICYINRSSLTNYIDDAYSESVIDSREHQDAQLIIDSMSEELFYVNYIFDNQHRSYIGSNDPIFSKLRNLCKSRSTLVNFTKDNNRNILISLEVGQI